MNATTTNATQNILPSVTPQTLMYTSEQSVELVSGSSPTAGNVVFVPRDYVLLLRRDRRPGVATADQDCRRWTFERAHIQRRWLNTLLAQVTLDADSGRLAATFDLSSEAAQMPTQAACATTSGRSDCYFDEYRVCLLPAQATRTGETDLAVRVLRTQGRSTTVKTDTTGIEVSVEVVDSAGVAVVATDLVLWRQFFPMDVSTFTGMLNSTCSATTTTAPADFSRVTLSLPVSCVPPLGQTRRLMVLFLTSEVTAPIRTWSAVNTAMATTLRQSVAVLATNGTFSNHAPARGNTAVIAASPNTGQSPLSEQLTGTSTPPLRLVFDAPIALANGATIAVTQSTLTDALDRDGDTVVSSKTVVAGARVDSSNAVVFVERVAVATTTLLQDETNLLFKHPYNEFYTEWDDIQRALTAPRERQVTTPRLTLVTRYVFQRSLDDIQLLPSLRYDIVFAQNSFRRLDDNGTDIGRVDLAKALASPPSNTSGNATYSFETGAFRETCELRVPSLSAVSSMGMLQVQGADSVQVFRSHPLVLPCLGLGAGTHLVSVEVVAPPVAAFPVEFYLSVGAGDACNNPPSVTIGSDGLPTGISSGLLDLVEIDRVTREEGMNASALLVPETGCLSRFTLDRGAATQALARTARCVLRTVSVTAVSSVQPSCVVVYCLAPFADRPCDIRARALVQPEYSVVDTSPRITLVHRSDEVPILGTGFSSQCRHNKVDCQGGTGSNLTCACRRATSPNLMYLQTRPLTRDDLGAMEVDLNVRQQGWLAPAQVALVVPRLRLWTWLLTMELLVLVLLFVWLCVLLVRYVQQRRKTQELEEAHAGETIALISYET
ncbi:MAG: hypothetical protein MHM6MM_000986 [Cercozoa sp. M6MM]